MSPTQARPRHGAMPPRIVSLLLVGLLSVGVSAGPAHAQDVPRVAIVDFNGIMVDATGTINIGAVVTDMLITEFTSVDGIQVLERAELKALLDEIDLTFSGRASDIDPIEAGRLLSVQYFFFGQVSSFSGVMRMDIRAVDAETSEVVSVHRRAGRPIEALLTDIVDFAAEFADRLDLQAPSERPEAEDIPAAATIEYSRGLNFEDRGDTAQAIVHYERTLEIHPGHRTAQRALERLRGGG